MQGNDVIEVVTPLGVGSAKLPYSRITAVLAGTAGVLEEPARRPASIIG
jgi:uncharacterized linocin/CFP29 family protein